MNENEIETETATADGAVAEAELQPKAKLDFKTRLLCGAVATFALSEATSLIVGGIISIILDKGLNNLNQALFGEALGTAGLSLLSAYTVFLGIALGFLACLAIVRPWRPYLKALWRGPSGNRVWMLVAGLLLGLASNALCVGIGVLTGSLQLEFTQFSGVGLLAFLVYIFIQASTEEIVSRGFVYQRVYRTYGMWPAVIVSAATFAIMHTFNDGFSLLPCINIFLIGVVYALAVRYLDSIWVTMGAHTAWNLTQNIIFGLPNSGTPSTWSIFSVVGSPTGGIAYDTAFGIEGAVFTTLLHVALIAALLWWGRRHAKPQYDIWAGVERTGWFY